MFTLPWLSLTILMLQSVATEGFRFALSGNVTTGWRTVCHFVHRAGDWRGGSPSQKAGCCPKSAAHCCTAPGQRIRDSKGQRSAYWTFLWRQRQPLTNKQWFSWFLVIVQTKHVHLAYWICYSEGFETLFMEARVSSLIRSAMRLNSASLLRESKH